MPETDTSPPLNTKGKLRVQKVVGSFMYYGRALDMTILAALIKFSGEQINSTENTMKKVEKLLEYMATNTDAVIRYYASAMILNVHSDASYMAASKARSRACGHFLLGSINFDGEPIVLNGAILTLSTILKCVAASVVKAELGALFLNAMEVKILRITLEELGYPQPPTPIHCDNTTSVGIVNSSIKRQISRAINMRDFWLLCHQAQYILHGRYHTGQ